MNEITMSIIIPVYNVEDYLEKCLNSVIDQKLENTEIFIVNDGSTDHSQIIIDKFVQKYPGKFQAFTKENGGLSSARNYALRLAKGEYVAFLDSDDWIDENTYEKMYQKAKEEDADIVICDTIDHYPSYDVFHYASQVTNVFEISPAMGNKIFRRSALGNLVFPYGIWYEDLVFSSILFFQKKKIARASGAVYHYYCREESTMNNHNAPKNLDMISALDMIEEYLRTENLYQEYYQTLEYMVIQHLLLSTIIRVAVQNHPEKEDVIKKIRLYIQKKYPKLLKGEAFKNFSINKRIVARLNYYGFYNCSINLIKIKKFLFRKT